MARDSVGKTIGVALGVCVVCASVVSAMAVGLRADQKRNAKADVQKNILMAAQIYDEERPIEEQFERVEPVLIDLETGEPAPDSIDPATFDQRKAAASSALSTPIDSDDDLAGIKKRSKYAFVYLVRDDSGAVESLRLPSQRQGAVVDALRHSGARARPGHGQTTAVLRAQGDARVGRRGRQPDSGATSGSARKSSAPMRATSAPR